MEAVDGLPPVPGITDVKEPHLTGDPPSEYIESSETCQKSNGVADITTLLESADAGYAVAVSEAETLQSVHSLLHEGMFQSEASAPAALPAAALPHAAELLEAMETSEAVEHLLGTSNTSEEVAGVLAAQPILSEQVQEETEQLQTETEQLRVETEQSQAETEQLRVETEQSQAETEQLRVETEQSQAETEQLQAETDQATTVLEEITTYELMGESVTFTTQVLVEKSDPELDEPAAEVVNVYNHTNDLLHELGQGIELSEALRSSDSIENNNCSGGEEVFNNEELLDILEGNNDAKALQKNKELALNQLSRLKRVKKSKNKRTTRHAKKELVVEKKAKSADLPKNQGGAYLESVNKESNIQITEIAEQTTEGIVSEKKDDSIVDDLVKDWDDDEPSEVDGSNETVNESTPKNIANMNTTPENIIDQENTTTEATMGTPAENAGPVVKESGDEAQPPRRQSRVIKKKVPFDPDNPPTFAKKVIKKEKDGTGSSSEKEQSPTKKEHSPVKKVKVQTENLETPPKKPKTDQDHILRSNSKSPVSKTQWKKPTPKNGNTGNGKQLGRRLTEVDKLLMDEGAVNMIYQLTPEAGKGKKNMRTKAEFIKKVQSTDGNEMKFRERKKEVKSEDAEAKKISGGKTRSSLSSSVKSPMPSDDVETHSADDSIIYRRHSSSSYSDCMSPRRMSDVDPAAVQAAARSSRQPSASKNSTVEQSTSTDVFTNDSASETPVTPTTGPEILLTMKDKLNKKLSQALNKRKRETTKTEKPPKQKKLAKELEVVKVEKTDTFKYVSVAFDQRLAEICIRKTSPSEMIFAFKELDQAFQKVDSMKEISVTLLTSECGGLCSDVDLLPMLDTNMEKRTNYAYELAESIKRVLSSAATHSKFLVSGAWGACSGVGLALLVLSDAALATDTASFSAQTVPPIPGLAAITAGPRTLPHALVNDLVVFGRRLSTAEAAVGGLVTRMWPGDSTTVRFSATQLASLPPQSILLKKQLLSMRTTNEATASFMLNLVKERDMLVEYWTSIEGQDVIRATLNVL